MFIIIISQHQLTVYYPFLRAPPHAACSAFIHGLSSKWTYFLHTIPDIANLLVSLDEVTNTHFILVLTGQESISDAERQLLARRLALVVFWPHSTIKTAALEHTSSLKVTAPLAVLIVQQSPTYSTQTITNQRQVKSDVSWTDETWLAICHRRTTHVRIDCRTETNNGTGERGGCLFVAECISNRRPQLYLAHHFRDVLCLWYGWQPTNLPSRCVCAAPFTVEHALSCPTEGFPTLRHNKVATSWSNHDWGVPWGLHWASTSRAVKKITAPCHFRWR